MTEEHMDHSRHLRTNWASQVVSWGQLLVALVVVVGGVFMDRVVLDRRVTVAEERGTFMSKMADADRAEVAQLKVDLSRRLDDIRSQLTQISVDIARNQATSDRLNEIERRSINIRNSLPSGRQQ